MLGKRPRPRGAIANGEVRSADQAVKPAAQRLQHSAPMRDCAKKVGVVVKPTPDGLREAVLHHVFSPLTIVAALLACFTNTKRKFNKQSHERKSVRCVCTICPRFEKV